MSFAKDLLFGEEGTPATVQDLRSDSLRGLGEDATNIFRGVLGDIQPIDITGSSTLPTTANLTGGENNILSSIQSVLGLGSPGGNQLTGSAQNQLLRLLNNGGTSPIVGAGMPEAGGLVQDILSGRTMDPSTNPALQASIQAAQQPLIELFGDQMGDLRGQFTRAGQFVQPGASSPFEREQGRLQTGLANALGNVSTNLVANNMNQERGRQTQILDAIQGAFETGQNRQLTAAQNAPGFTSTQLTGLLTGLEASALPRLVEQYGIDEGQRRFERQQNQLLGALTTAFSGGASPQAVSLPGSEGSTGLLGGIAGGAGSAFGSGLGTALAGLLPFSDLRLKENIRPVSITEGGNVIFKWDWRPEARELVGEQPSVGPIAQLVQLKNPEAVVTDESGYYKVDLDKVA